MGSVNDIILELDKLIELSFDKDVIDSLKNTKKSLKSYGFVLSKSTCEDIYSLIKLSIKSKSEIDSLALEIENKANIIKMLNVELELKNKELLLKDQELSIKDQELKIKDAELILKNEELIWKNKTY